jgi:hypothetical protein
MAIESEKHRIGLLGFPRVLLAASAYQREGTDLTRPGFEDMREWDPEKNRWVAPLTPAAIVAERNAKAPMRENATDPKR